MDPDVQRTINEAMQHGALVEFYAAPDACLVCRALLGKVFEPHDAPLTLQSGPCLRGRRLQNG